MNRCRNSMLFVLAVCAACSPAGAQDKGFRAQVPKQAITADDLNRKFVVIGPLGIPLGQVATVEGIALVNQGKGARDLLQVTSVNGRALNVPVTMAYRIWPWSDLKRLTPRSRYRLRVYQDGGFTGVPAQVMKETGPVQTHAYCFVTTLMVVRNADSAAPAGK